MYNKAEAGLYLHIPFCMEKCRYCDFYSFTHGEKYFEQYENRLHEAIEHYEKRYARRYNSLYFGGGTPLCIGEKQLCRLLEHAGNLLSPESEVTVEGNPAASGAVDFASLKAAGANRLSFGLQSSDAKELAALGRIHSAEDARDTVLSAQKAGFENISLDLMIGIPYQTAESLRRSIKFCAELGVTHISAYMLKIEPDTPLAKSDLRFLCADEEKAAELYLVAVEELSKYGFEQYEISNFARGGAFSRHNLRYWLDGEYLGLGPSAHSFMEGRRFYFERSFKDFMETPFDEAERFEGEGGSADEYAMLRLRLNEGLDLDEYKKLYPNADTAGILRRAALYERHGLLTITGSRIAFTPKGMLLSNTLTAEVLWE